MAKEKQSIRLVKEAEVLILGCFIVYPDQFIERSEGLTPGHFQHYALVAESYWKLIDEGKVPNEIVLSEMSDTTEVLDFHEYADLERFEDSKKVVLRHSVKAKIRESLARIDENIDDFDAVLNQVEKMSEFVTEKEEKDHRIRRVATEFVRDLQDNPEKKPIQGIPTGISYLDKLLSGWNKTDLNILAGRPGMGKTSLALQFGSHAAKQGFKVLLISLEMSEEQLNMRYVTQETGKSQKDIHMRNMNNVELSRVIEAGKDIAELPIYIYDEPDYFDCDAIYHLGRRLVAKKGIDLIIIDYLQLIGTKERFPNDNSRVSHISRRMKMLAKNTDKPVILLSQLSRAVETRGNKRPQLSDLRDSGAIEQDADTVLMAYRPKYYDESTMANDELIIAKNRHGNNGICTLEFRPEHMIFKPATSSIKSDIPF